MRRTKRFALTGTALVMTMMANSAWADDPIYTGLFSNKAVSGYDVVAYFSEGKPVQGKREHKTEYLGAQWFFSSEENLQLFVADPQAYTPQYGGYCAWAVAQGDTASAKPEYWTIVDGKLYLNFNEKIQKRWEEDIPEFISTGDTNWPGVLE